MGLHRRHDNFLHEQTLINIDLSNAGGVGFYVKNDLTFTVLSEISCTTADYEALWIEIQTDSHGHNIICGVIYRHSNDNLDSFFGIFKFYR